VTGLRAHSNSVAKMDRLGVERVDKESQCAAQTLIELDRDLDASPPSERSARSTAIMIDCLWAEVQSNRGQAA